MNLYQRIKTLAYEKKISINQLEKDIGIQSGGMCKWDKHIPSVQKVKAVADILEVSVDELLKEK